MFNLYYHNRLLLKFCFPLIFEIQPKICRRDANRKFFPLSLISKSKFWLYVPNLARYGVKG